MQDETARMATQAQIKDTLATLVQSLKHPMTFAQAERIKKDKGTLMAKVQELLDVYATPGKSAGGLLYMNCSPDPDLPKGMKVFQSLSLHPGLISWRPEQLKHLRLPQQKDGITGYELRKLYQKQPGCITAHFIDHLLKNGHPNEELFYEAMTAWGTVYVDRSGNHWVRYVYFNDQWCEGYHRLDWTDWKNREAAGILYQAA